MACQSPLVIEGQKVACRTCDYCVARRINGWCSRAMMEKDTSSFCYSVTLTYSEETEHSRRSARFFDYRDVQEWLWSLRRQIRYHFKVAGALSFIVAGELGDREKRCHWHVLIFSNVDILELGKWKAPFEGPVTRAEKITTDSNRAKRRNWSLWPFGFVVVQEPDWSGMRYAVAYALKDQFNVRKSEKQGRAAKAEVFSASYFAMSKKPPIGARFIERYLEAAREGLYVPPTRKLQIPGCRFPYWPSGNLREMQLRGLSEVNALVRERTGRDAAGWSTLLYEARESEPDLEILNGESLQTDDEETDTASIVAASRERSAAAKLRHDRIRCGSTYPCALCLRGNPSAARSLGLAEHAYLTGSGFYVESGGPQGGRDAFLKGQRDNSRKGPNPFCGVYGDPATRGPGFSRLFPSFGNGEA